jgi:hypothetical protein
MRVGHIRCHGKKGCRNIAPATTGLCTSCGGREGRQPDGTYRQITWLPPTPPPLFGRRGRRDPGREAEAGQ